MRFLKFIFIFYFIPLIGFSQSKIKVAAVGNSVTYGSGIENRKLNSYPSYLQNLLGGSFLVKNFGKPGATLLNKGHNPYIKTTEYFKALEFSADIIIIHLGLNDTDPRNWPQHKDNFHKDYYDLIQSFKQKNPSAKVFICLMTPIFPAHPRFGSSTLNYYEQIQKAILEVAQNTEVSIINLNHPLRNRNDLFPDALHPNKKGALIIAKTIYKAITKNYGSLKLDQVFSNQMVLQRNKPITFWGSGEPTQIIKVNFNKQEKITSVSNDGNWLINFLPQEQGGPYKLIVQDDNDTIELDEIWVGDVWIAAGQSNMAFELKNEKFYDSLKIQNYSSLSIYNLKPIIETHAIAWEPTVLEKINDGLYFNPTRWENLNPENAKTFSAIAYYFGTKIHEEINIPIGIISLPIGGSPTESWISRRKVEHDPLLLNFLKNWDSDYTDYWVRERAKLNLKNTQNPYQQHPYKPSFLYEYGMKPLEKLPIAGVIWYQGESNASNLELHEKLFTKMIEDWRERRNDNFPIYFVQLSSLQRNTWAHFRNSQRLLNQTIPSTGMVVSSDIGDKTNVHPTDKKTVGLRLASLALADYYHLKFNKSGPIYQQSTIKDNKIHVEFTDVKELKTSNGKNLNGFEIAGKNKIFYPVRGYILKNKVILENKKIKTPSFIRYGWQPYSEANLTDEEGFPASTFYDEIK